MIIEIKEDPLNQTGFKRGTLLNYEGALSNDFIVIGEDDTYLHTIQLKTGVYWGVLKATPNLAYLVIQEEPTVTEGLLNFQSNPPTIKNTSF